MTTLLLSNQSDTLALGKALSAQARIGDVITLTGTLGAGKTVLARGFVTARMDTILDVASPTFTLVNVYDSLEPPIWHFDLYRLESADEVEELGLDEALTSGISLIEWPDRAAGWLPEDILRIDLRINDDNQSRTATLSPGPAWRARVEHAVAELGQQ